MTEKMKPGGTFAIIVAAGRGRRFADDSPPVAQGSGQGAEQAPPKQYSSFRGRPLLATTLEIFLSLDVIDGIVVVINPQDEELYQQAVAQVAPQAMVARKLLPPVVGGAERQASVYCGLLALEKIDTGSFPAPRWVLIHDGARPCASPQLVAAVATGLVAAPAVVPCLPLTGAIKETSDDTIVAGRSRHNLAMAQTPQGFDFQKILVAHQQQRGKNHDDDASVWQASFPDLPITMIAGEVANIKITTRADRDFLENHGRENPASRGNITISTLGVDLHRFADTPPPGGATIMLGGVAVAAKKTILAHSDGDVILHALTDAILGALGQGDIGVYFPPSDPQWRGAASSIFVAKAMALLQERAGRLVHVDITVLLEEPRLSPYRAAIVSNVARLVGLPERLVGFKVTTTEKMGDIGAGRGIMAMVQATVELPA